MTEKLRGIVTDVVHHNDRHNIVTLYTRQRGRISFLSLAGAGRTSRMRNARLQPMSVIETEVRFNSNRELQTLGAVSVGRIWRTLYFDPAKRALTLFLSEFLNRLLRTASPDRELYDFIETSLARLDWERDGVANFHIAFLINLLPYVGIVPDISGIGLLDYFDMRQGVPVAERPLHKDYLSIADTMVMRKLLRMRYDTASRFRFSIHDRRTVLRTILQYYGIHFPGVNVLKSVDILEEIFS